VVVRRPLTLVVFDLDGTLVDSRQDLADAANELLVACGAEPLAAHDIGRMVGDGAATLVARAFHAVSLEPPPDALARFLGYYGARLTAHTRPYPGIPAALSVLSARHRLAILTNKPLAPTRAILDALDLTQYFDASLVVGGDGPFARKPDPAGLRALVAGAGAVMAQTCLVGDSMVDLATARAAGAACCLVRYGFGFEGVPETALEGVGEDEVARPVVIDSPDQLPRVL
jgi:phosphoglycolate phosphatase